MLFEMYFGSFIFSTFVTGEVIAKDMTDKPFAIIPCVVSNVIEFQIIQCFIKFRSRIKA